MGEAKRRIVREVADRVAKDARDKGLLIEAGWLALQAVWLHPESPPEQVDMARHAFFAGAQHLFGSIMGILDPVAEPTAADYERMDLIAAELDAFIKDFELRHLPTAGNA